MESGNVLAPDFIRATDTSRSGIPGLHPGYKSAVARMQSGVTDTDFILDNPLRLKTA